jgi:hypothetical protein
MNFHNEFNIVIALSYKDHMTEELEIFTEIAIPQRGE